MSPDKIYELLCTLKIPVAYDHFADDDTKPPFILYRSDAPETFKADDITYYRDNPYIIDLITSIKDLSFEQKLEELFTENHLSYEKMGDDYIDSEKIYQIRYMI